MNDAMYNSLNIRISIFIFRILQIGRLKLEFYNLLKFVISVLMKHFLKMYSKDLDNPCNNYIYGKIHLL